MSYADEARYGRMSLLLLNVCPYTLRHVINDYHIKHGSTSLQDFLDKNKHDLYHILNRRCCCRLIQSRVTPMNRSQWDLLFIKNSSACRTGYTGDCPCQFDAKPGVTPDVMDITLCCLLIKNICSRHAGINMSHVETIRSKRNQIIHTESAQLDVLTYNGYWNQVKTALLDLANHVSPTVHTDTLGTIQELETRVMNAGELGEIRKLIVDEKRIEAVEERVTNVEKDLETASKNNEQVQKSVKETAEKVKQIEGSITQATEDQRKLGNTIQKTVEHEHGVKTRLSQLEETIGVQGKKIEEMRQEKKNLQDKETDVNRLKQRLIKVNNDLTKVITLSPLQERGKELPIELLFSQVVIRKDPTYTEKGDRSDDTFGIDTSNQLPVTVHNAHRKTVRSFDTNNVSDSDYQRSFLTRILVNPYDLFKINEEFPPHIYMLGDAAHGKTTYCKWLVKKWCNAQNKDGLGRELDVWEKALKEFDFVFLLEFRYVNPIRACVVDMICLDVYMSLKGCHAAIRHVLSSEGYKSLIIMDGLDEWDPNEETRKQLMCHHGHGMPNVDELSSMVTNFISMRPWVFPAISKYVQRDDIVIEILGLSKDGMEKVIRNVLLNYYKLTENSSKYIDLYKRIKMNLKQNSLKSFMQIPLLAVVCVQIWCEGKQIGESMTSFYAEMLDMLIERANEKRELETEYGELIDDRFPEILSQHESVRECISVLTKLGKIAYEGLISNETNLVFQKRKLEKEIGKRELQFALDVGLISETETESLSKKNVSVSFFHKSIQEFLAAIYMVTNKVLGESFCKHLSSIKVIMELSNVIRFICGMCPSLGSVISQRVVSVADSDKTICKYRESLQPSNNYDRTPYDLYKVQLSWYRELQDRQTDSPVTFYVSDVFLCQLTDTETVRKTRALLSDHRVEIWSLILLDVPTYIKCGITNIELNDILCNKHNNARSLVMVNSSVFKTDRFVPPLCIPSLIYLHLSNVKINDTHLNGNRCPSLLTQMTSLHVLKLSYMTLCDRGLDLSGMTSLQVLELEYVTLDNRGLDLSSMTSLQKLTLTDIILGDGGLDLSCMTSLQVLELAYVTLDDRGLDFSGMTSLQKLTLTDIILGDRGLDLSGMTSLQVLELAYVTLDDRGLDFSGMTSLQKLTLTEITLGDRGLDLSGMKSLQVLELAYVTLDDKGLDLSGMTSLQKLTLTDITLSDRGLYLSDSMLHIKNVNLCSVDMSAEQWQQFLLSARSIRHKFYVSLEHTNIDDESRTKLRSSPNLFVTQYDDDYYKDYDYDDNEDDDCSSSCCCCC